MIEQTTRRVVEVPAQRWENEGGAPIHKEASGESAMREQVRVRAFAIYSSRTQSGEHGDAASDWARAEREITEQASSTKPTIKAPATPSPASGARETTSKTAC